MSTPWTANLLKRHVAFPQDHGSWVFLLSPLLIGMAAGGGWRLASGLVVLASLSAFLIRQPFTVLVKVYSGRRSRRELNAAIFWITIYNLLGLIAVAGLLREGYPYLLLLALPAIPVFAWHLILVSRRAERRQLGVEIVASGVLALSAPAGLWVGLGYPSAVGWWLWILTWLQSAASIVHATMRLAQREFYHAKRDRDSRVPPPLLERLRLGWRALVYSSFNLALTIGVAQVTGLPKLMYIPYAIQWAESLYGFLRPAMNQQPTQIGVRQLIISTLFTLLFILVWTA